MSRDHTTTADCDVLIVGGGHAGCEAAAAAARIGAHTIILTLDPTVLGRMSCNPAIGGIAKGHLVREIDALGGIMPRLADQTAIQFRVLNRSKGFAVWSPRAQCDRSLYSQTMYRLMSDYPNVELVSGMAVRPLIDSECCVGVKTENGDVITAGSVVLTCGTFLNGLLHWGDHKVAGGRLGEAPVTGLTSAMVELGLSAGRLKTGTPPRLDGSTIDFSLTERQDGDRDPIYFSTETTEPQLDQIPCHITYTNEAVHDVVRRGLDRSPLFRGEIAGRGPRYCPSIEDKIVRFPDRSRHTIFLEPEGLDNDEIYPNGFSTSLPEDVQLEAVRHISGCTDVVITQPGYAVEYDYFPPHQLHDTLETKLIPRLFLAGQINGTSGYEEAAAQGLAAGANAAMAALNEDKRLTFDRDEAYIGVLIDDLITRGTDEPYRMFTSRAEYRLKLRLDNAEARLTPKGFDFGLVDSGKLDRVNRNESDVAEIIAWLSRTVTSADNGKPTSLRDKLKRPDVSLADLLEGLSDIPEVCTKITEGRGELARRVESEVKYEGYLKRQESRVKELHLNRSRTIPGEFSYRDIGALSAEGREKLSRVRPDNLGQASNIPGITPADLAVLLIHLRRIND